MISARLRGVSGEILFKNPFLCSKSILKTFRPTFVKDTQCKKDYICPDLSYKTNHFPPPPYKRLPLIFYFFYFSFFFHFLVQIGLSLIEKLIPTMLSCQHIFSILQISLIYIQLSVRVGPLILIVLP